MISKSSNRRSNACTLTPKCRLSSNSSSQRSAVRLSPTSRRTTSAGAKNALEKRCAAFRNAPRVPRLWRRCVIVRRKAEGETDFARTILSALVADPLRLHFLFHAAPVARVAYHCLVPGALGVGIIGERRHSTLIISNYTKTRTRFCCLREDAAAACRPDERDASAKRRRLCRQLSARRSSASAAAQFPTALCTLT